MATDFNRLQNFLDYLDNVHEQLDWKNGLRPKHNALPPPIPRGTDEETIAARWQVLPVDDAAREVIADDTSMSLRERFRCNVENFIGTVKVPVGVAGPEVLADPREGGVRTGRCATWRHGWSPREGHPDRR